jgi:hypothetical protein
MQASEAVVLTACAMGLAAACGGEGTGPSPTELAGTWQVVKCEYVSTQGLGTVDLIAGGGSGTLVLTATDTFRLSVTPASGAPVTFTGTYEVSGIDLMKVTPAGVTWYWAFDMSLSGSNLTLSNGSGQYDFDHNGQPDDATWNLTMRR